MTELMTGQAPAAGLESPSPLAATLIPAQPEQGPPAPALSGPQAEPAASGDASEHPTVHWLSQFAAARQAPPSQTATAEELRQTAAFDRSSGGDAVPSLRDSAPLHSDKYPEGWTRAVVFLDNKTIVTGGMDGELRIVDVRSGRLLEAISGHSGVIRTLVLSRDKKALFSTDDAGAILRWTINNRRISLPPLTLQEPTGEAVRAMSLSPDGRSLVTGDHDGSVTVWDAVSGAKVGPVYKGQTVYALSHASDGRSIFAAGRDGTVRRIDLNTGAIIAFAGHTKAVRALAQSPDGAYLATSGEDGTIRTWDVQSGRQIDRYDVPDKWVRSIYFSADGRSIYTGNINGWVDRVGVTQNGKFEEARHLYKHDDVVYETVLSPRGDFLVSTARDLRVGVRDKKGRLRQLRGTGGPVHAMYFLSDGTLVGVSHDGSFLHWDSPKEGPRRLPGHARPSRALAVAPDGTVATGGDDRVVLLRRPGLPEPLALAGHTGRVRAVAFSPDMRLLASGGDDLTVRLWDARTGAPAGLIKQPDSVEVVHALAFSPDGRRLATAGRDGIVRLWNPLTGALVSTWEKKHPGYIRSIAFSPDGRSLVTGGRDGSVWLWDARTGVPKLELKGHTDDVNSVEFDPTGRYVLSASDDKTVRLWDVSGTNSAVFKSLRPISAARFTPDGSRILAIDDRQALMDFQVEAHD
jgi:WD40 repeat protein